jgi:hypothetical protein
MMGGDLVLLEYEARREASLRKGRQQILPAMAI